MLGGVQLLYDVPTPVAICTSVLVPGVIYFKVCVKLLLFLFIVKVGFVSFIVPVDTVILDFLGIVGNVTVPYTSILYPTTLELVKPVIHAAPNEQEPVPSLADGQAGLVHALRLIRNIGERCRTSVRHLSFSLSQ